MKYTTIQTRGPGWGIAHQMVSDYLLFHLFPIFSPLPYGPKSTRFNKIHISTRKYSLSEISFSPSRINTLGDILLGTMADSTLCFTMLTNNICFNPTPHMVVTFYFFLYVDKKNVNRGIGKGYRKKLRNSRHKGRHKIGCYLKSLLIFTTYQVQGWWNMIISPVKYQPHGINIKEILLKSSWHTYLKHSKP